MSTVTEDPRQDANAALSTSDFPSALLRFDELLRSGVTTRAHVAELLAAARILSNSYQAVDARWTQIQRAHQRTLETDMQALVDKWTQT